MLCSGPAPVSIKNLLAAWQVNMLVFSTMNTMRLNISSTPWARFAGKWYFTLYMDYCLELRVNKQSVSLHLRDLTRTEDCELIPIRATDENIIFRMESSWLNTRLRLYPKVGEDAMIVEMRDGDFYDRADPLEVPQGRAIVCEPGKPVPEWAYGTWREYRAGFPHFVQIERAEGGKFRFAKWQFSRFLDIDAPPPQRGRRVYDYVQEVVAADAFCFHYVRKGKNELNHSVEEQIFFDETRHCLWLSFTMRELARRRPAVE